MKVCICGSRSLEYMDANEFWDLAMEGFRRHCQQTGLDFEAEVQQMELLHGGARGIDKLAGDAAAARGLKVSVFDAQWSQFGNYAGHMRNIKMVAVADVVIAIWDRTSPGTADTMHFCKTIHKPLYVLYAY